MIDSTALSGLEEVAPLVEAGERADLLIYQHSPLSDAMLVFGTGAMRLKDDTSKPDGLGRWMKPSKGHDIRAQTFRVDQKQLS